MLDLASIQRSNYENFSMHVGKNRCYSNDIFIKPLCNPSEPLNP